MNQLAIVNHVDVFEYRISGAFAKNRLLPPWCVTEPTVQPTQRTLDARPEFHVSWRFSFLPGNDAGEASIDDAVEQDILSD